MNTNEVLANRAAEILGGARGAYDVVHPNDHVNMGQSTNDVFPTATRLALLLEHGALVAATRALQEAFEREGDATLLTCSRLGARTCRTRCRSRWGRSSAGMPRASRAPIDALEHAAAALTELNLGATAVGTGLNAGDDYTRLAIEGAGEAHESAVDAGKKPLSRDSEHGRHRHLFRRDAPARRRTGKDRQRSATALDGTARGDQRDPPAGRPARIIDHAGQGQSVRSRDGESGLLSGVRLRRDGVGGCGGRSARTQRDDAGDRVECAARADDSHQRDDVLRERTVEGLEADGTRRASCWNAARRSRRR